MHIVCSPRRPAVAGLLLLPCLPMGVAQGLGAVRRTSIWAAGPRGPGRGVARLVGRRQDVECVHSWALGEQFVATSSRRLRSTELNVGLAELVGPGCKVAGSQRSVSPRRPPCLQLYICHTTDCDLCFEPTPAPATLKLLSISGLGP